MRVAATIGCSIKRAQREVDSEEFTLWQAAFRLRLLEQTDDERTALIAFEAHHANPFARPRPFSDWLPKPRETPQQSEKSMRDQFKLAMRGFARKDVKRHGKV